MKKKMFQKTNSSFGFYINPLFPKNKKALLIKKVTALVIALIGISLFIIALYKIFTNQPSTTEHENAESFLNEVVAKINSFPLDQTYPLNIQGFEGADDWVLVGYSKSVPPDDKPQVCFTDTCICTCQSGICESDETTKCELIEIESIRFIDRKYKYESPRVNQLFIEEQFMKFEFSKNSTTIKITHLRNDNTKN